MGATIFNFLTESFLFDDISIDECFRGFSEEELKKGLRAYREYCLAHLKEIEEEAAANSSSLKMFSGMEHSEINLLKQSAFYVEQHVLQDPLFPLTHEGGEMNEAIHSYLQLPQSGINRKRLSSVLRFLKSLTPMVAANYVKFLPSTYLFEPQERIPIYCSPNYFGDILPPPLMKYFHSKAIVNSLRKTEDGWQVEDGLRLCRGICVSFKDHRLDDCRIYNLFEQDFGEFNESDSTVGVLMHLPETPPSQDHFDAWVYQSINRTAGDLHQRLLSEIRISSELKATYLTDSKFSFDLMGQVFPSTDDIKTNTLNTFLNMELPFLDKVDIETLMKVRQTDGEAFNSFRLELDSKLKQLRLESNPNKLRLMADNAIHEIGEVQLHKIGQKVSEIKRRVFADATILSAGLYGSVQAEGWSVLVLGLAMAKGYKTAMEYWENVRQNPSFFLWRVLNKKENGKGV
jgi:hypothetical protein